MCGQAIDLSRIAIPCYVYASREDHIVPWRSAYQTTGLVGGDLCFVLGSSGHIAGVVNPPRSQKRNYWTNDLLTDAADDWLARAEARSGSWWPHWYAWAADYGGGMRQAPRRPGNARHPSLGPAPGSYVVEHVA
jgi:polyhydroxyalkanoate synthase